MKKIRLATRSSPLALAQSKMVAEYLSARIADAQFEFVEIKTSGDKQQTWSLERYGGKGLFTKEIEEALLGDDAEIAVHSAKDLPTDCPDGLEIAGCLPRDACADVLVIRDGVQVPNLIATGSPRRRAQLKKLFPQAVWTEFRGNVHTRLKKLAGGAADASVLSQAGLVRLKIDSYEGVQFRPLKPDICVPAVAQGIIALQCRSCDAPYFRQFTHEPTNEIFALERAFLTELGGGCQSAYAANCAGNVFRIFHEDCGFEKIEFPSGAQFAQKLDIVKRLARKCADC